jgi:hypothetical protein
MARREQPRGAIAAVLENGSVWLCPDPDADAHELTFALTDLPDLRQRYPRLHAALTRAKYQDAPRLCREP